MGKRRKKGTGSILRRRDRWFFRHPALNGEVGLDADSRIEADAAVLRDYGDLIAAHIAGDVAGALVGRSVAASARLEAVKAARGSGVVLAGCWERFEKHLRVNGVEVSASYLGAVRVYWGAFVAGMPVDGAESVTRDMVVDFFDKVRRDGSDSRFNGTLAGVRVVWRATVGERGPLAAVSLIKAGNMVYESAKRPFTDAEQLIVVEAAEKDGGWIRGAVVVALATGWRLGDVVTLRWVDVLDDGFLRTNANKTKKPHMEHCAGLVAGLLAWPDKDDVFLFPRMAAAYFGIGRKADRSRASKEFRRFLTDLKLPDDLGFSSIRKTVGTAEAVRGGLEAARVKLGHGSAATTDRHYVDMDEAQAKQAARARANPLAAFSVAELLAEIARRG